MIDFVKNRILIFFILASWLSVITSCGEGSQKAVLPSSSGKVGEMLVVVNESQWNGIPGEAIRKVFQQPIPALTQYEPTFSIVFISHKQFSKMFRTHRNILIVDIDKEKNQHAVVERKKNVWADNQLVYTFLAACDTSFQSLVYRKGHEVMENFISLDIERLSRRYKNMEDKGISAKLLSEHKCQLVIPHGYNFASEGEKFAWIRYERPDLGEFYQSIVFWYADYTDTSMFSPEYVISVRDSIGKQYIHGSLPNTYMSTVKFVPASSQNDSLVEYPLVTNRFSFNGQLALEIRGLWRLKGDFMGGPFVSISTYDPKQNRFFTVEGFVYAPKYDKRVYLREIEAIIRSLRFP